MLSSMEFLKTRHEQKSFLITIFMVVLLLFLFSFIGLKYIDPPIEYGMEVNLGYSDIGKGLISTSAEVIDPEPDKLKTSKENINPETIITDVGSTKSDIMSEAKLILDDNFSQFIGSHPIAGSEKHGPSAAKKNLFQGKNIVLTPNKENSIKKISELTKFWELMGGKVTNMDADDHDQIFSTVSHLPHLLAFSLVSLINHKENKDVLLNFANEMKAMLSEKNLRKFPTMPVKGNLDLQEVKKSVFFCI